jgi:hypothetical protein
VADAGCGTWTVRFSWTAQALVVAASATTIRARRVMTGLLL